MRSLLAGLSIVAVALAGCASQPPPSASQPPASASQPPPSATPAATAAPTPTAQSTASPVAVAGGCGGTQVFAGPGPDAHLGLWDNPWAAVSPGSAGVVAYFWLKPPALVRVMGADGSGTKVLWIVRGGSVGPFEVSAHPLDAAAPVVQVVPRQAGPAGGYPSDVAVATPGCWRLEITSGTSRSTLDVLVAPTAPS